MPDNVIKAGHVGRLSARQKFDYVVCSNKLNGNLSTTLRDLSGIVRPSTTLVTAQNGMDVELPLRKAFPHNTILTSICNIGCSQALPGLIEQTANLKRKAFLIGVHSSGANNARTAIQLRDHLASMDPEFDSIDCVTEARWRKLIFNCAWNSTTAFTGLDTHQLLQRKGAAEIVLQLATEVYKVAIASGISLDPQLPFQTVETAANSAPITPSTLQDAKSRRPMELSPIFGKFRSSVSSLALRVLIAGLKDILSCRLLKLGSKSRASHLCTISCAR